MISTSIFGATNVHPNTLFTNDCLFVLNGMNSECIDLIYLDPPFNKNKNFAAPVGSKAAGSSFKDMWTWDDVDSALLVRLTNEHPHLVNYIYSIEKSHSRAMMAYIAFMAQRIFEMHRVLKPTGSIYLHCDQTAGHYLKIVMDSIFGNKNFRNEIVWGYAKPRPARKMFVRNHDTILFYAKSEDTQFNPQRMPNLRGEFVMRKPLKRPDGTVWKPKEKGVMAGSWWHDIPSFSTRMTARERTGYPTQKPEALLDRIIKASSNDGDLVLDPFCGCATTMVVAQILGRKWIGIDIAPKSGDLIRARLSDKIGSVFDDFVHFGNRLPSRNDMVKRNPRARDVRQQLYGMQSGKCNGCKELFDIRILETDHIIPVEKGGGDFFENYQLLCSNCNRIKGNRPMEYLMMVIAKRTAQRTIFGEIT